jgi:uncharacterized protein (DUF305 family)
MRPSGWMYAVVAFVTAIALVGAGVVMGMVVTSPPDARDTGMTARSAMMADGRAATREADFLAAMVAHHEEAVASARELGRSYRATMRDFGSDIVVVQSDQIRQMRRWLHQWYPDQPSTEYTPMMQDLAGLSGDALDRTFLQEMIGHHMVAVMMSQRLLRHGTDHAPVAVLARSIRDEQAAEIAQMRRWLARWFGPESSSCPP